MTTPRYRLQARGPGEPWTTLATSPDLVDALVQFDQAAVLTYDLGAHRFYRHVHLRVMHGAAQVVARSAWGAKESVHA